MIFKLHHMIGGANDQAEVKGRGWARAVPLPFYDGLFARIAAAWEVVRGRAYPVEWPKPGELEDALQPYDKQSKTVRKLPEGARRI